MKGTENQVEEHLRNQGAAEARERKLKHEAGEIQSAISEQERTLRDLQLKAHEIQRQIAELQARLRERQRENERAEADHSRSREEQAQRLRDAAHARKEAEDWGRKVAEGRDRISQYRRRLQQERRASLQKYLDGLWTELIGLQQEVAGGNEARAAFEMLNRARHDNPHVAELWETRQEWLRIAQSAGPLPVRETARCEVQRIEGDLEKQFPGALKAASTRTPDELLELYFFAWTADGGYSLPLCIPNLVKESLDAGKSDPPETLAARLVWSFARAFEPPQTKAWRPRFEVQAEHLVMILDSVFEGGKDPPTITFPVGTSGRVTFMLSELPAEIRGAMNNENTDL
jgi:hypothetical protein